MIVIDPGHVYDLDWLDGKPPIVSRGGTEDNNRLTFVKRTGDGYPGNQSAHPGTNMQEVLRALIERVQYLDGQISDTRNVAVVNHLRLSIWLLEIRAAERHGRSLNIPIANIELLPTCKKCGHVQCEGKCHV